METLLLASAGGGWFFDFFVVLAGLAAGYWLALVGFAFRFGFGLSLIGLSD